MKTKHTILSLLLAAASAAGAQTSGSNASSAALPVAPKEPSSSVRAVTGKSVIRTAAGDTVIIPTTNIDQVEAPVGWSYSDAPRSVTFRTQDSTGPVTFLGVSTSQPSPELSSQLAVPSDTGLVVDFVTPGSPAEKAGVQNSDVLTKLDDQILILPGQLAVLVANHKEGDGVKISLIRKGQPQEITATLSKQEGAMSGISADLAAKLGDIKILVDGKAQQPLRTFTRRFTVPAEGTDPAAPSDGNVGGSSSGGSAVFSSGSNARMPAEVLQALKRSLNQAGAQARIAREDSDTAVEDTDEAAKSVREELKDMRRMLEELNKKIKDQKK